MEPAMNDKERQQILKKLLEEIKPPKISNTNIQKKNDQFIISEIGEFLCELNKTFNDKSKFENCNTKSSTLYEQVMTAGAYLAISTCLKKFWPGKEKNFKIIGNEVIKSQNITELCKNIKDGNVLSSMINISNIFYSKLSTRQTLSSLEKNPEINKNDKEMFMSFFKLSKFIYEKNFKEQAEAEGYKVLSMTTDEELDKGIKLAFVEIYDKRILVAEGTNPSSFPDKELQKQLIADSFIGVGAKPVSFTRNLESVFYAEMKKLGWEQIDYATGHSLGGFIVNHLAGQTGNIMMAVTLDAPWTSETPIFSFKSINFSTSVISQTNCDPDKNPFVQNYNLEVNTKLSTILQALRNSGNSVTHICSSLSQLLEEHDKDNMIDSFAGVEL